MFFYGAGLMNKPIYKIKKNVLIDGILSLFFII